MCRAWQFLTVPKRGKHAVDNFFSKRAKHAETCREYFFAKCGSFFSPLWVCCGVAWHILIVPKRPKCAVNIFFLLNVLNVQSIFFWLLNVLNMQGIFFSPICAGRGNF